MQSTHDQGISQPPIITVCRLCNVLYGQRRHSGLQNRPNIFHLALRACCGDGVEPEWHTPVVLPVPYLWVSAGFQHMDLIDQHSNGTYKASEFLFQTLAKLSIPYSKGQQQAARVARLNELQTV